MIRNKMKCMGLLVSSALLVACGEKNVEHQVCIKGTVFQKERAAPFFLKYVEKTKNLMVLYLFKGNVSMTYHTFMHVLGCECVV